MSDDKRTRFSAVFEEMMTPAAAVEASPSVVVPKLFEQEITVRDGVPDRCPRCTSATFEPVGLTSLDRTSDAMRLWCRACPRDVDRAYVPTYVGTIKLQTTSYKCASCGMQRPVTVSSEEINLRCHSTSCRGEPKLHRTAVVQVSRFSVDNPSSFRPGTYFGGVSLQQAPTLTVRYSGSVDPCVRCGWSVFTPCNTAETAVVCRTLSCSRQDVTYDLRFEVKDNRRPAVLQMCTYECASCVDRTKVTSALPVLFMYCPTCDRKQRHARMEQNDWPSFDDGSARAPTNKRSKWDLQWNKLQKVNDGPGTLKNRLALGQELPLGIELELPEFFRRTLGLEPFDAFESARYLDNCRDGIKDTGRRTGRTTRGLIVALSTVIARGFQTLFVRGGTEVNTAGIVAMAWGMYKKAGFEVAEPLITVARMPGMPGWRDVDVSPRRHLFTDHHYDEVTARDR